MRGNLGIGSQLVNFLVHFAPWSAKPDKSQAAAMRPFAFAHSIDKKVMMNA
jgi:hypothetical protein